MELLQSALTVVGCEVRDWDGFDRGTSYQAVLVVCQHSAIVAPTDFLASLHTCFTYVFLVVLPSILFLFINLLHSSTEGKLCDVHD